MAENLSETAKVLEVHIPAGPHGSDYTLSIPQNIQQELQRDDLNQSPDLNPMESCDCSV